MKHASVLMDRVLFLEGLPNLQRLGKLRIGETVPEQLEADLALEMEAIPKLRSGIKLCSDLHDHGTRDILEQILESEEEHVDWIETQLSLIKELGRENYLAEHLHG